MANVCTHGYELADMVDPADVTPENPQRDTELCPVKCADPRCGCGCLNHAGQACDDGGANRCTVPECYCRGYIEP